MSVCNIPLAHRLKKSDLFLVACVSRRKLKEANGTIGDVLRPIVDDLRHLQDEGIDVSVTMAHGSTSTVNIKSVLSSLSADNLGMVEILGLKSSWGKGFRCRFCGIGHNEMQQQSEALDLLKVREDITKLNAKEEASLFCELEDFTIFNSTPPDLTHDLSEGVLNRVLVQVLLPLGLNYDHDFSRNDAVKVLEKFKLRHGNIKYISYNNKEGKFDLSATALQVIILMILIMVVILTNATIYYFRKQKFSADGYKFSPTTPRPRAQNLNCISVFIISLI